MKIPQTFLIFPFRAVRAPHASRLTPHCRGIALVITLIMLSITLVMAVAFLALAKRERSSVSTHTEITTARLAAEAGLANAEGQIAASILANPGNAYNARLFVSTNYINPRGFVVTRPPCGNPTNVNYQFTADGSPYNVVDYDQNIANLWILPRPPVFIITNPAVNAYDFRYYLDLNENGRFDTNGWQAVRSGDPANPYYDTNGNPAKYNPPNVMSNYFVGDPEWVGVLEHPDQPHGPLNHFTSRYAFAAVPIGNALDANYIYNQAANNAAPFTRITVDNFMRNQGVGSWEINLAAFLADLNTNLWGASVGSGPGAPLGSATYYQYNQPALNNSGYAFQDAFSLLSYRYGGYAPLDAWDVLRNAPNVFPYDGLDAYSDGPLQTNLDINEDSSAPGNDGDRSPKIKGWSGADNPNHFFAISDFFDATKLPSGPNTFMSRLSSAGTSNDTYNAYTYYRLLDQLGTDSSPEDGKLNLNYSNAVVKVTNGVVAFVSVITGAETNLTRWAPTNFFLAAADQMLRLYTTNWYSANPQAFANTYGVTAPFGVGSIPVWVSNRFVYTTAVNRLLQLAANIYDASTNGNFNLPHVFRPVFTAVQNGTNKDVFVTSYTEVTSVNPDTNTYNSAGSPLATPFRLPEDLGSLLTTVPNLINIYGVPWIIGAKKGFPSFNQLSMANAAQISRRLQVLRPNGGALNGTNQMYLLSISNNVGLSFWNPYNANYYSRSGQKLTIYASDSLWMNFTNNHHVSPNELWSTNLVYYQSIPASTYWPGSGRSSPTAAPSPASFLTANWPVSYIQPQIYHLEDGQFYSPSSSTWDTTLWPLDYQGHLGLMTTNYLQAFILDGTSVIDYVQFRDPRDATNLDVAVQDPNPNIPGSGYNANYYYLWETNGYNGLAQPSWGIVRQIDVSESYPDAQRKLPNGINSSPQYANYDQSAVTTFFNFIGPGWSGLGPWGHDASYVPCRTVFCPYLLQANDPLVHYLAADLSSGPGVTTVWANGSYPNATWGQSDGPQNHPLPQAPATPIKDRYQPWGCSPGQMAKLGAAVDQNVYNLAYKDPLVWGPDYWDFPTNSYPTVGWLGRVHRGTPWQTVYLKSTNILSAGSTPNGVLTWINWLGSAQTNFYDAMNAAPQQDYRLFDLFTTRFNDNSARGTLPVNAGMNRSDGGLAAWSALFSGMVALTNTSATTYSSLIINPAGPDALNSPLWTIVNGSNGINVTRANTNLFPTQVFSHVGQILATPALSLKSPFLTNQFCSDEIYEWLPQQMMGLVRDGSSRYVLYCYGQALSPAPNGTILGLGLVTNYQVVAESTVRAVIRVDNANTSKPHVVVESYNVLPPN